VLNGRYGPYVTNGKKNAKVPKDRDPKSLTLAECAQLIADAPARGSRFGRGKRAPQAKVAPERQAALAAAPAAAAQGKARRKSSARVAAAARPQAAQARARAPSLKTKRPARIKAAGKRARVK
jgi:DNA topoisomerase I